jgi:hypothetical protein
VSNRKSDSQLGSTAWDDEQAYLDDLFQEVMEGHDADVWEDLIHLVEALAVVLRPVSASPQFLRDLGEGLAAAAAPAEITIGRPRLRRRFWLGAVLSGSLVSAMGVLFVWLRRRNRRSPLLAG